MARRQEPWTTYGKWLVETRALNPTTISTYLTLVRRILRNAELPLTSVSVGDWIDSLPAHHRSPHRAAYRAFAEWSRGMGHVVPALPTLTADITDEAIDALDDIVRSGIPAKLVGALKWDVDDSPAKRAAFPDRIFVRVDPAIGDYAALPAAAAATLRAWAYGDRTPGPEDLIVPRSPGSADPLPYTALYRMLRMRNQRVGRS